MPHVIVDPDSRSLDRHFALIRTPKRNRVRFPEGCATLHPDEAGARASADPSRLLHAAEVYGPSASSEGQRIYYLVRWLD